MTKLVNVNKFQLKGLSWNTYNKVWASQKINITSSTFCLCRVDSSRVDDNSTCDLAHGEGSALYIKVNVFECDYYIFILLLIAVLNGG